MLDHLWPGWKCLKCGFNVQVDSEQPAACRWIRRCFPSCTIPAAAGSEAAEASGFLYIEMQSNSIRGCFLDRFVSIKDGFCLQFDTNIRGALFPDCFVSTNHPPPAEAAGPVVFRDSASVWRADSAAACSGEDGCSDSCLYLATLLPKRIEISEDING